MSHQYLLPGLAILCVSCGQSSEKQPSLEQTRAAIEVRGNWKDELKPIEILASDFGLGVSNVSVRITTDGKTNYEPFSGNAGNLKPGHPSLMVDTAVSATACWPAINSDTLVLTAPFCERLLGVETARTVDTKVSLFFKFKSQMALLRLCFESDNITDMLDKLTVKGENIITRAKYMPYAGNWIENSGKGIPLGIDTDCILNNGRNHDIYLVPCEGASDIILVAKVNGKEYTLKTKVPPLLAGSMTQLNLKVEKNGQLIPKSSWVDNERKLTMSNISVVDTVRVGNYLRKDGLIVAQRDTATVAVVYQTDGRHGKAIAIDDCSGKFSFGRKSSTSGRIFETLDGKRREGIVNASTASEEEKLIFRPKMPYPDKTAFGYGNGAVLTSRLLNSKEGKTDGSMLAEVERQRFGYVPSVAELTEVYYQLQPYSHSELGNCIEPLTGEYLTSSESGETTFYGIAMEKGIITSTHSKQYAQLKLRLFYLF